MSMSSTSLPCIFLNLLDTGFLDQVLKAVIIREQDSEENVGQQARRFY